MRKVIYGICILILLLTGCRNKDQNLKNADNTVNTTPVDVNNKLSDNKDLNIPTKTQTNVITNEYHPIILCWKDNDGNFSSAQVIGGSKNNKWYHVDDFDINYNGKTMKTDEYFNVKSEEVMKQQNDEEKYGKSALIKGDEIFKFYSSSKFISDSKVKDSGVYAQWSTGDLMLGANVEPFKVDEDFLIGINGSWNALPRFIKTQADKNSFSIDLDGDRKEEVIRIQDFKPEKSEGELGKRLYLEREGKTILIDEYFMNSSYYPEEDRGKMELLEVRALDLNGDGILEVIVKVSHGYGVSVIAYELKGNKAEQVLGFYDGD